MSARRVLVVDDLEDTATSLAYLLETMGCTVNFATHPLVAMELAKTFRPELVFLDIGMPGLDGWRLCKLLKSEPALQGVRLFAITGYAMTADRQRSLEAGFEDHFVKPLDFRVLENLFRPLDHA